MYISQESESKFNNHTSEIYVVCGRSRKVTAGKKKVTAGKKRPTEKKDGKIILSQPTIENYDKLSI